MSDALHQLSACEAAAKIANGDLTSEALTAACLEHIAARNDIVHAFAHLDPEFSLAEAKKADARAPCSPLHGVPFAIKDVIDTADFPTEYGSSIHRGHRPNRDARSKALPALSLKDRNLPLKSRASFIDKTPGSATWLANANYRATG